MPTTHSILSRFNNLKTLPHVAIRLTKLISDVNSSMNEFDRLVRLDPTLVVRILRLVNSSYYGLRENVEDISRAIVFIGMSNLRNMIVTEALKDIFNPASDGDRFSRQTLWLHSAAVSICSQMISERIFGVNGEDSFLCGILHDIGMIVEDQVEHDLFTETCRAYNFSQKTLTDYEKEILGTTHCNLGFALAQSWGLPRDVQDGIKYHHYVFTKVEPSSLKGIIQMADYFVTRMKYSALPEMQPFLSPPLVAHVKENLVDYKALVNDLPDEMAKAKELYEQDESGF